MEIDRELERGQLRQIQVAGITMPNREIALIYRRGRPLSRAARAFVEVLEERYGVQALPREQAAACSRR